MLAAWWRSFPRAAFPTMISALWLTMLTTATATVAGLIVTTTASMIALVLLETGRDPMFLIGGELRAAGTNAAWGDGEWAVIEADESDRSFLKLRRDVAVVTNIELDHHATYGSLRELEEAFDEFTGEADTVVLGGVAQPADGIELGRGSSRFRVDGTEIELQVPGEHNVLNALAALGALRAAGVEPAEAAPALAKFTGAGRRFEAHGRTATGAEVYDDYAHHPTEVRAALEAARTLEPRRLVAAFQPHLYSRTKMLAREFGESLAVADLVVVLDIYRARERPEDFPGVTGYLVAEAAADAAAGRPVWWMPTIDAAEPQLRAELGEGDVLVTLGAGNIDDLAKRLAG